jgi:uncharacterized protein with von Willebrand factor type A (vWA) domain
MKTIDGWYLKSLAEHLSMPCYLHQANEERKDIRHSLFQNKIPTLSPADVISKALIDLTQALKGKSNQKRIDQIEALKRLNTILSNKPEIIPTQMDTSLIQWRETFDEQPRHRLRRNQGKQQ